VEREGESVLLLIRLRLITINSMPLPGLDLESVVAKRMTRNLGRSYGNGLRNKSKISRMPVLLDDSALTFSRSKGC
jgi:hypothetical protein